MSGEGNKPQRTPGALHAPTWAGHSSDPGGGERTPPVISQVWHVIHMEGNQWKEPGNGDVLQGVEEESEETAGGRDMEEQGGGLSGLWETFGYSVLVQIPWGDVW